MDLVDKIIELTDLFDDNVVTTADKIPQPEPRKDVLDREAINRFMKDNPPGMADGGMLVQPGFGGTRQGYKGITEYNLEQRKAAFQELFNKHGENVVRKAFTDETGIKNLDKILKDTDYKKQKTKDILNNFKQKFKKNIEEAGKFLPGKESRIFSRGKRIPVEQGIQIKLLEATNSKDFFDPKAFAKANKISMATLRDQAERLQTNIYKKRIVDSKTALGIKTADKLDFIPNDAKITNNTLTKLGKSELIFYDRKKIDELFFDAFGREPTKNKPNPTYNPKKFLAIKKNLNEYRQLKKAINKRFPNINFDLDHPLSKSTLNNLFSATTEQLTRVNPLDRDLNRGFKDALSQQYEKAMGDLKKGIKPNLNKKKAVEKIARDLKLNIGKISDDATNFKYGVKEFQKLNIKNEIANSLLNLSNLNKNFQTYAKNNPKLFEAAGVNPTQTFTRVTPSQLKKIQNMLKSDGPTLGANLGFLKGFGEAIKAVPTLTGGVALNAILGVDPTSAVDRASIAAETAFAPQLVKQAAKFGPVAQKFFNLGLSPAAAMRVAKVAQPAGIATLAGEGLYNVAKYSEPNYYIGPDGEPTFYKREKATDVLPTMLDVYEQADKISREQGIPYQEALNQVNFEKFERLNRAGGGIAGLSGGDKSGPPPQRGPNSEGLSSLMKRGTNT